MSYVEEIEKLRAELAACREANRVIHEQDAANVAKLQAIRAEVDRRDRFAPTIITDIRAILDGAM